MLDRGATMNVKNPMIIQNYLNSKTPSTIADTAAKALDNHNYANFDKKKKIIHLGIRLYIKLMSK